jgi:hypothetical protein
VRTIEEFAAQRRGDQDTMEKELFPEVSEALQVYPATNWYTDLLAEVSRLYIDIYHREGGSGRPRHLDDFLRDVRDTLDKTENPTEATADRVSTWLATAVLNAATQEATADDEEFLVMEWVTMHDEDVRSAHVDAEGQQRPPGEPYEVGGHAMRYPGDPTAPIELWMNCRCALAPTYPEEPEFFTAKGVTMTNTETEEETVLPTPLTWHGVLAPEGVWSGDGRRFAEGALQFRDLPLPLTWQKSTDQGHDGSVVVGKIERIERVNGLMHGSGTFLANTEADEAIGLIAEFGRFGVSVDADNTEFEFDEESDRVTFTSARIASASLVSIPSFAEAFVALGPWAETEDTDEQPDDVCDPESENYDEALCTERQAAAAYVPIVVSTPTAAINQIYTMSTTNSTNTVFVSDKPWSDFTAADYTDEQWKAACVMHVCDGMEKSCHKLPIKEPGGALNRNGVHAAAARYNQTQGPAEAKAKAKASLRGAYKQLGEEPPDVLKAAARITPFDRGPGWITHPIATKRIHDYWTKPGKEGYAKIGWGKGGDFTRCKTLVGQEIAENSPEDMVYLNEICARWHHDALGIWPGEHHALTLEGDPERPSVTLVASGERIAAPAAWFADPHLSGPTHLTVTEEGRVFGHLAEWETCHIGFDGVCVAPPTSASGYAYFATGRVLLDDGAVASTGVVSLGGGHAGKGLRPKAAMHHYDATSTAVADVCVGEDDYGIWCAGWIRPGTSEEQVVALRASDVSGDWREIGDSLELVAALACNVGGFPVGVAVEDGRQTALVAAGIITERTDGDMVEQLAAVVEAAITDRKHRRNRMRLLRDRVEGK